jgi:hypothetical protein
MAKGVNSVADGLESQPSWWATCGVISPEPVPKIEETV